MTYIKVEQTHTDDERWIEAGADAFAVHIAAIVYCDRQLTDGRISPAMAARVCLAVPPDRTSAAVAALVEHGFWRAEDGQYVIDKYDEHAFPAEQVKRTRDRWKGDKDRRRQHSIGDHSLCKEPKFAPPSVPPWNPRRNPLVEARTYTQPNQTRPDQTGGRGLGWGGWGDGEADTRSASATRGRHAVGWKWPGLPPGVTPAVTVVDYSKD